MPDTILLLCQALSLALIGAWLFTGVRDNIRYPRLNEEFTAEVLEMTRLKADYPEQYDIVAHRAIGDRPTQLVLFRLVVLAEALVALLLWIAVAALILALLGGMSGTTARAIGLLGATGFTAIWGAFLVVGNHFSYWFGHEGAQNTHYQMALWGMGNMIFLAI